VGVHCGGGGGADALELEGVGKNILEAGVWEEMELEVEDVTGGGGWYLRRR
jgi:hypothetical protein